MARMDAFVKPLAPHWWLSTDNLVRVDRLQDLANPGIFINDATVSGSLTDDGGVVALTFTYVAGSNGRYHATLEDSALLTAGKRYTLEVVAVKGGVKGTWRITQTARYRSKVA